MKHKNMDSKCGTRLALLLLVTVAAVGCGEKDAKNESGAETAAVSEEALSVLRGMSETLAAADAMVVTAQRTVDPALLEDRNVSEKADVAVSIVRPNKLVGIGKTANGERQLYFDGQTFVLHDKKANVYGLVEAPGDLDNLFNMIDERLGFSPPMVDFLRADCYAWMTASVTSGRHLGRKKVAGKTCHHLSFVEELLTWELWVGVDDKLPWRFVIRATALEGDPEIRLDFKSFELEAVLEEDIFLFTPSGDMVRAEMVSSETMYADER